MNIKDLDYFIIKSNKIYNFKYDYRESIYISNSIKLKIICPEHGEFYTTPGNHYAGSECKICKKDTKEKNYIKKATEIHKNRYDYSKIKFKSLNNKVDIICPEHGIFKQTFQAHIHFKNGCPKCFGNKKYTEEEIINNARSIHGDKYDYSKIELKNVDTKISIICPDHGKFYQTPYNHINNKQGCPACATSQGERLIEQYLQNLNINYIKEYRFKDCKNIRILPFDFYLPKQNIAIEFDGIQHFKPITFFGGDKGFNLTQQNDNIKNNYCNKNNIKLIRIKYNENIKDRLGGVL